MILAPSASIHRWNYQWSRLDNCDAQIFSDWLHPTTVEDYRGLRVLDAGCGKGSYTRLVAGCADRVVGLDKHSIPAARENVGDVGNIDLIEGDLETFEDAQKFDAIFSVGVLHHLDDPRRGFDNLLRTLKPGGRISVWVYGREGNAVCRRLIEPLKRCVLLRLPLAVLRVIAWLLTCTLYPYAWLCGIGPLPYGAYLEKFRSHPFARNYMNVFDKLNAPRTHWISREQIASWFAALERVTITPYNGISWRATGFKPLEG